MTGVIESSAWPVPIREVQLATAITGCAAEGGRCLAWMGVRVEAAAVPVPMFAVQCCEGGTLVSLLLVTGCATGVRAASPVPMRADQWSLVG